MKPLPTRSIIQSSVKRDGGRAAHPKDTAKAAPMGIKDALLCADPLACVHTKGFGAFFAGTPKPSLDAVIGAFSISKKSLTQRLPGG